MGYNTLIDVLGWIGAVAILVAYGLVSTKKLESHSTAYQMLNLVGGILLIANTIYYRAYPSAALNTVWAGIAVYTIVRYSTGRS